MKRETENNQYGHKTTITSEGTLIDVRVEEKTGHQRVGGSELSTTSFLTISSEEGEDVVELPRQISPIEVAVLKGNKVQYRKTEEYCDYDAITYGMNRDFTLNVLDGPAAGVVIKEHTFE